MAGRDFSAELYGPPPTTAPVEKDQAAKIVGRDFSAELYGTQPTPPVAQAPAEPRPEDQSVLRQFADVPLKLTGGVLGGVRMIADAFGADSSVSKNLKGAEDWVAELYSAQSKKDSKRMSEIMKEAEDKGVLDQVTAAVAAFRQAPVDLVVQSLGTAAPAILASLGAFVLGAPAAVTTAATLGTGAIMGAGTIKGAVYETVKNELQGQKDLNLTPQQIEKIAVDAQSYGGKNLDSILTGSIIGAVGARTGAERIIAKELANKIAGEAVKKGATETALAAASKQAAEQAAKRGVLKQAGVAGATEFATEFPQGAQEQLAQNLALQREGVDVPTMRGVVGQGTLEGLAGFGMGTVAGGREAFTAKREYFESQPTTKADDAALRDTLFTTAGDDKRRAPRAPTADDVNMIVPATDAAGKALTEAAPETTEAKTQADATAAAAAQAAQLSLDEATVKANDLLARVDGGGKAKQTEFRPIAKALGVKLPFGIKNDEAIELIRSHLAQQGVPSVSTTGTVDQTGGASVGVAGKPDTVGTPTGTAGDVSGGVAPTGTTAPSTAAGKGAQPGTVTPAGPAKVGAQFFVGLSDKVVNDLISDPNVSPGLRQEATEELQRRKASAAPPPPGTQKPKSATQTDEDLLKGLLGDDDLFSRGTARRTDAQIARDEQLDSLGKRYGLNRSADETAKEFGARIKEAIDFEKMREGRPMSEVPSTDIAGQSLRKEASYIPPDLQVEAYETERQKFNETVEDESEIIPAYDKLTDDERRVYFQEGITRPGAGTPQEHARAARRLSDYRLSKREETVAGETQGRQNYERERDAFGRKTGLSYSFPAWGSLSDASKQLFTSINKTNTVLEQDMAFRAVKAQIQKEKTEQASTEALAQAETDATRQMLLAAERARKAQPGGKVREGQTEEEAREGGILPDNIIEALARGDIKTVLDYIRENGNGVSLTKASDFFLIGAKKNKAGRVQPVFKKAGIRIRNSVAMQVFRGLAATLGNIDNFKVNVVFDENMVYDQLARYDAKTNTMYVGPNGLNEATILHELTHAATVKIIHQFFTDASKLTPRARQAVEQLIKVAAAAKKRLGSKYPNAFENLYEFVAYSQTDMDFQYALAQEQIGKLAEATAKTEEQAKDIQLERESKGGESRYDSFMDTLWNAYTGTLAYMYKLFTPGAKSTKVLMPTEKSRATTAKTKKEEKAAATREEIESKRIAANENIEERELSVAEREALAPESLFDDPDAEMKEAKIEPLKDELVIERGVANLKREILREPGYKGNLLLEASEMFQLILAAPEGGIEQLAGKESIGAELYARKSKKGAPATAPAAAPAAAPSTKKEKKEKEPRLGGVDNAQTREFYKLSTKEKIVSTPGRIWRTVTTAPGWRDIVRRFQDKSVESRSLFRKLDMAGLINRDMDGAFNNFDEQRDLATGEARNFVNNYLRVPMDNIKQSIGDYAKLAKKSLDDVMIDLHMFAEMFHEPERREVKWVTSVPLSTTENLMHNGKKISAAQRRIDILGDPRTGKPGIKDRVELTEAQQKQLWAELTYLANNHADAAGDSPRIKNDRMRQRIKTMDINKDSALYNVLGINQDEVNLRTQEYQALPAEQKEMLDKIFAEAREITKVTSELNKIGNYWSYPVSNLVGMYNYQHYLPFKGVSKHSVADEFTSFDNKATGKELQEIEHAADGRFSTSDNPLLQMMSDAFRSAGRAGRRNYMQSIKNAVESNKLNPTGTGIIKGKVAKHIEFAERNTVDLTEYKGGKHIFVYNPDGSIDIVTIDDPKLLNALRYSFRDASPLLDMANVVTGFFGAMHTRYNYNFAPKNFVVDMLTNAWNMGAELGPLKSAQYIKLVGLMVAKNGLGKAMEVAALHEKGDPVSQRILASMAAKDPFVRDMLEYLRRGGKTTYLESFSLKSSLHDLNTRLDKRRIMDKIDSVNEFIDVWNNMFEFTSRAAAFSIRKQELVKQNIAKGMSKEAADRAAGTQAAAWTKNLANFEKAGEHARGMGAAYMFVRPSATGAVRAAEAILPAFRPLSMAVDDLPEKIQKDPRALEEFKANYTKQQRYAQIMVGALIGSGMALYYMSMLMSPDDEWKRNNVKNDNMGQWTRFARFHIPDSVSQQLGIGRDVVFQVPWGFGQGAFAAIGAQIAGLTAGASSFKEAFGNIVTSLTDSFLPLPMSRIPPTDSPLKWAIDTIAPSVLRPGVEFLMNTNGIGQAINSAATRRMGDAYTGGDRIPEVYKDAADYFYKKTLGKFDISPNTLYFFANSYLDGLAKIGEIGYSWVDLDKGEKAFNIKTDLPLFGSFFGAKVNVDSREYGEMEKKILEIDKRMKTLNDLYPELLAQYEAKNPMHGSLVDAYRERQGELNRLRSEAKEIRTMRGLSPKAREQLLRIATIEQNVIKHEMVEDFKAYGLTR